jgi:hypothetical protein
MSPSRSRLLLTAGMALATVLASSAQADQTFPARLAGHAMLPAQSFIPAPPDAPSDMRVSGKYTTAGRRVEQAGSVMGRSGGRPTGVSVPFNGQPVQGFSGIRNLRDGTFLVLTDNGFGSKANSPDAMLFFHRIRPNWTTGAVEVMQTTFLHDPDKKVPFRIVNESTEKRYLTGADFDLESIQPIGDKIWIGDEFGPYLIRLDRNGKVEAVFETQVDGKTVRSPDNPAVATAGRPDQTSAFAVQRSRGYEGMAASPDGRFLYPLLEGPLWEEGGRAMEQVNGREYLRILEFDVQAERWTGRHWKYVLEQNGLAIGDFNMIDATTALVIERDNGEGTADKACPVGQRAETCFHDIARFKRIYKIEMNAANAGAPVRKIGHIDLMNIADPDRKARVPLNNGVLTFPFFTIENVDVVDARHIIVGNDNNLPFSSSRDPNKADDNELVLLEVEALLNAR